MQAGLTFAVRINERGEVIRTPDSPRPSAPRSAPPPSAPPARRRRHGRKRGLALCLVLLALAAVATAVAVVLVEGQKNRLVVIVPETYAELTENSKHRNLLIDLRHIDDSVQKQTLDLTQCRSLSFLGDASRVFCFRIVTKAGKITLQNLSIDNSAETDSVPLAVSGSVTLTLVGENVLKAGRGSSKGFFGGDGAVGISAKKVTVTGSGTLTVYAGNGGTGGTGQSGNDAFLFGNGEDGSPGGPGGSSGYCVDCEKLTQKDFTGTLILYAGEAGSGGPGGMGGKGAMFGSDGKTGMQGPRGGVRDQVRGEIVNFKEGLELKE